ncbi:MAG: nucleoside-diphosphate kinase [Acidimicrobiaceae bacterium]|nr:nucleoside-diphosphate kinase [Acidimicrobiaceae bacterium]
MDRTLVIIKPDGVERGLVGEILARFERKLLTIELAEMRHLERAVVERHYSEHVGKPFYEPTVEFMTSGPVMVVVLKGPLDTWKIVRSLVGVTNAADAAAGTIRGDFGIVTSRNLVHASDSAESALREIGIFFPHLA